MEEPEEILKRIMEFEESYTPQFTNLIKQSIVDNVSLDIEDDPDGDNFPQLPQQNPITRTSTSDTKIIEISQQRHKAQSPLQSFLANQPNLDKQAISLSTPMPNTMPSYKQKPNNRQATPIISRAGSSQNTIKKFDQNSFINLEDLQYNSSEEGSDEDRFGVPKENGTGGGGGGNEMEEDLTNRFGNYGDSEEDDFEDEEVDPLIEEYDSISHEIHKSKLRLRKIDRQMTVAQRNGTSTSDLVKQHSDIKIKIAQLISKRRKLETHDVVRAHIKEDDTPTVEIGGDGPGGHEQPALLEAGLMEINEDEEEEDEEQEVRNNNISPTTQSAQTSDSDPTDDQLKGLFNGMNGYGDDPSRSTLENFDYSYDAKGDDDDDEDDMETGSVQFHSSPDEDDDDEEDGGGSVQYHSSAEEEDDEEESDGGGSMQMHPDVENNEDWFGDDTQNGAYDDDEEDDDGSGGGGSVQMNDVENNENWVDEEFDTKSIEIKASDDEENQEMEKKIDDMLEAVDIVNEARTMINKENDTESGQDNKEDVITTQDEKKEEVKFDGDMGNIIRSGGRSRRLEQMKKHRNHKDHKTDLNDLNGLKQKYHDRRRHRERIEVGLFSINDLVKGDSHDEEIDDAEFSLEQFVKDNKEMVENMDEDDDDEEEEDYNDDAKDEPDDDGKEERKMDPYRFDDDNDDEFNVPALPKKKKSVVLDIEKYSSNLAAVIEEDGDDDDDEEKYFQTVEYQTDSDCDSNDSVVVKKEILKNVTVNDLQKFDTV